jgi:thiol-disulfide isomerase/thioredoxin
MKILSAGNIVLKVLGLLLLTAAVLKGQELLTVPAANRDFWSWRPFLIFQVEFELALGLWLLSGLFPRLAWLAALLCFGLFCGVTLYKGLTGAASCGCFGRVHVDPWVTLLAVDLPAVVALGLFRPRLVFASLPSGVQGRLPGGTTGRESLRRMLTALAQPLPSRARLAATAVPGLALLGLTTPMLAFREPAPVTSTYEVLEPQTWVGKELPILKHIDIAEKLGKGRWLVLLYHHDCPDCAMAIPLYEQMARDLAGNEDFLQIALVAIPPYGQGSVSTDCPCLLGKLDQRRTWFVTTPATALLTNGQVRSTWEGDALGLEAILHNMAQTTEGVPEALPP